MLVLLCKQGNQRHPWIDKMWPSPARILTTQFKQVGKGTQYKAKHGLAKVPCGSRALGARATAEVFSTEENQDRLYRGHSIKAKPLTT